MTIQDLKAKLSILTVLSHFNLKANRNNLLLCPFHNDKTPSLQIYPKSNSYCCFSSNCNAGTGDQIELIQKLQQKGKHQALLLAHELLGEKLETLNEVFTRLKSNLKRSKKAVNYVKQRHLQTTCLEIGYNGGSYAQLKYCLVFALRDEHGKVCSLYGRSIYDSNSSRHYYTKNRKGLYPKYPSPKTKKLILTESIIDAASLLQNEELVNEYEVLAMYGTNGFSEEHEAAIQKLEQLEELVLFMDGDEAGRAAVQKYQLQLNQLLNS